MGSTDAKHFRDFFPITNHTISFAIHIQFHSFSTHPSYLCEMPGTTPEKRPRNEIQASEAEATVPKCELNMSKTATARSVLKFAKLSENAYAPTKGSARAAGYDLRSAYDCTIPANGKAIVKTDIQIRVPEGTYGRIAPRSGLAAKHHIDVGAGVVDEDYTGNVGVVLFNHAQVEFEIKKGDRIAQLVCEKIEYPEIEEVASLNSTDRGEGGFGSTGSN